MQYGQQITTGKAKTLYASEDASQFVMQFRDDTSAFDGEKTQRLVNKGAVNNQFNAKIMQVLADAGVKTHLVDVLDETHSLVQKLNMLPIECVIRNIAAGSLCRRLGVSQGTKFDPALFEFFLKNDELHDPLITDEHILTFKWATQAQIDAMKSLTHRVNAVLTPLFLNAGLLLVDYKVEFGLDQQGDLVLGDEFSPDGCRVWDAETGEVLDKDRFRQDLGDVVESYQIIAHRLGINIKL